MDIIIGIDFGTTNSCLSYYDKNTGTVKIIPNEQGNFTTPSMLFLNQDSSEILFGNAALELFQSNNNQSYLSNILHNLKRLIGVNQLDNNDLKQCFQHNSIEIRDEHILFNITFDNESKQFDIKSLVTFYLNYLKNVIKNHFNIDNNTFDIVITVPAYFNDYQRTFIKDCCQSINLNILNIINEPTAASLAYALDKFKKGDIHEEYILTFDCGGGTTDISLLHLDYVDSIYEVKNTIGDNFLGGEDITNNLTHYIISKLKLTALSRKHLNKIKVQAELIKKQLSYKQNVTVCFELGDKDYSLSITQAQFNEINNTFYRKIQNLVYYVLDDYIQKTRDFNYSKINSIIFVGGTTRIPYFKTLFAHIFPDAHINNTLDPDQTVSIGAAIKGALLKNLIDESGGGDTLLMDIVPLSIGIETYGGIMTPIISRNSMLPISRSQQFSNSEAYEKTITINIYQGERKFIKDNIFLTSFELSSNLFENYDKGEIIITVTFEVDSNSIIHAKAIAKVNDLDIVSEIQVTKEHKQILTNQTLEEILYYAEINKLKDNELSNQLLAKLELYDSFKYLLSVYHTKSAEDIDTYVKHELNDLYNHTFNIIQNYLEYSSKELREIKELFEKKWHNLLFGQNIVLKDDNGQIIEFGGTSI